MRGGKEIFEQDSLDNESGYGQLRNHIYNNTDEDTIIQEKQDEPDVIKSILRTQEFGHILNDLPDNWPNNEWTILNKSCLIVLKEIQIILIQNNLFLYRSHKEI